MANQGLPPCRGKGSDSPKPKNSFLYICTAPYSYPDSATEYFPVRYDTSEAIPAAVKDLYANSIAFGKAPRRAPHAEGSTRVHSEPQDWAYGKNDLDLHWDILCKDTNRLSPMLVPPA